MSSAFNLSELPNPFTPAAFLPPSLALETQISTYVLVGSLGAMLWDILTHLSSDFKLLYDYKFSFSTAVYFVSRWASLYYTATATVFETTPLNNCRSVQLTLAICYPFVLPSTTLLFFFRTRAVFGNNKYITAFFFVLWLSVFATCWLILPAATPGNIGPTKYCFFTGLKSYSAAAGITPLIHDTCVFIAISWRLMMNSHVDADIGTRAKVFIFGKYLPAFSKALLLNGQAYFLVAVCSNLVTVIMVYSDLPATYRTMLTVPNIMLTNSMACRVFRNAKFGHIKNNFTYSTTGTANPPWIPLTFARRTASTVNNMKVFDDAQIPQSIVISETTDIHRDGDQKV